MASWEARGVSRDSLIHEADGEEESDCEESQASDAEDEDCSLEVSWANVLQEEAGLLADNRRIRSEVAGGNRHGAGGKLRDALGSERFSLAFSGGGVRAAAFQSGVLWRLAEEGLLKNVDYLAAVSGGSYITAAFASQVLGAEERPRPGRLDAWYRNVVASTVVRMQGNAGQFVRDCGREPGRGSLPGRGVVPRALDGFCLLGALLFTLLVNPVVFVVSFLVPLAVFAEFFFAPAMRLAYCTLDARLHWDIFLKWSPSYRLLQMIFNSAAATFVVFLAKALLPPLKIREGRKNWGYLLATGCQAFLTRFTVGLAVFTAVIIFTTWSQIVQHTAEERMASCRRFVRTAGLEILGQDRDWGTHIPSNRCSDVYRHHPWFVDFSHKQMVHNKTTWLGEPPTLADVDFEAGVFVNYFKALTHWLHTWAKNPTYLAFGGVVVALATSVMLMPFFPNMIHNLLAWVGPLAVLLGVMSIFQLRIYGPLNSNTAKSMVSWYFLHEGYFDTTVTWCLYINMLVLPFYEELRAAWHQYYRRCLRCNYFSKGEEVLLTQTADDPLCPILLITGMVNDYMHPGDEKRRSISEISFSALHTGSLNTGYVRTPHFRTLSKTMALSAAGCLDAITLSAYDQLRMRFWLEVLNLSWGDYIFFKRRKSKWISRLAGKANVVWEGAATSLLSRVRSATIWICVSVILIVGWQKANSDFISHCFDAKRLWAAACIIVTCVFGLSFFGFLPGFQFLLYSPIVRQFHQATRYYFEGNHPPEMLYVTDGGVEDTTTIIQLMRRRCERILLVLAASDPDDDLGVLRTAMALALEEKVAAFYDPVDPRRAVGSVLDRYKADQEAPYMHLGISYGWDEDLGAERTGHLFIVKNRLPPSMQGQFVQPLLSLSEIRGDELREDLEDPTQLDEDLQELTTDALGNCVCCDCGHTRGLNCGRKFPHLGCSGYLWLTPTLFSSLCRLGRDVSGPVAAAVVRPGALAASWEAVIPAPVAAKCPAEAPPRAVFGLSQ